MDFCQKNICQIFIGMDRSLSCPHCPQPLGTFSALTLFSFPATFCCCSLAGEPMGNGITQSTGPFSFSSPVLTSPSPLLVFEERLFLGVRAPCMAFGLILPSQTWELHRLEDIHIPAGLTCRLAEIPLKEREA